MSLSKSTSLISALQLARPKTGTKLEKHQLRSILNSSSNSSQNSQKSAISKWIQNKSSSPPTTHTDTFDLLRASHLLKTLPTRQHLPLEDLSARNGDELGKGHHMIYFQPETPLRDLGSDGSSTEYNAPYPYTRRMWAGGSFTWPTPSDPNYADRLLKIGREMIEERSIAKIEYKAKGDMVFVHQKRLIWDSSLAKKEGMWGVKEVRIHVFRPPTSTDHVDSIETKIPPTIDTVTKEDIIPELEVLFTYTPTSPLLFRYSALTFNAHKIHYDHPHSINIEKQQAPLVHGPLTATLLMELAVQEGIKKGLVLQHFNYKASNPIVVDCEVVMKGNWDEIGMRLELVAEQDGKVGMSATALYHPAVDVE